MKVCSDLDHMRDMADRQHDENVEFRSYISQAAIHGTQLDTMVQGLTLEAMDQVDCVACHNCCAVLTAQATELEVGRMSCWLGLTDSEFTAQFVVHSALADPVLRKQASAAHSGGACALLCDGRCTVYRVRPAECRAYPLLLGSGFRSRLWGVVDNCRVCPIVSAVYEELKLVMRPRQRR
jgi:uncharacterized protein